MKKLLFFLIVLFLWTGSSWGQITVGTGTSNNYIPVYPYYGYSYSQMLYLQTEIMAAGDITTLQFYFHGTSLSSSNNWTIYLGHTSKTAFSSSTDWIPVTSLTEVYSNTFVSPSGDGWITFDITDFAYNNTDNLVIAVDENASGYNTSSNYFYSTASTAGRSIRYSNDNTNPDPDSPPTGTLVSAYANVILGGLTVSSPPNCATVVSPTDGATDVQKTATLNWGSGGGAPTGYKLYFGTDDPPTNIVNGTDLGDVTTYDPTPDMSYSTTYYWKIVPYNVNGDASGCSTWSFTTLADPTVTVFPYTEDFEDAWIGTPSSPLGWSQITVSGTNVWNRSTTSPHTGTYCAAAPWASAGGEHLLITPPLDFGTTDYRLKFWLKGSTSVGTDLKVQIADNNSSASSFTTDLAYYIAGTNMPSSWTEYTIDLSAYEDVQFIAFRMIDDDGYSLYIDDVTVEEVPSCTEPSDLTSTGATTTGADLGWTDASGSHWDLFIVESGDPAPDAGTTPTFNDITSNPYTWTGGVAATTYDWYVRSDCGEDDTNVSPWTGPDSFTTLCNAFTAPYTENFDAVTTPALPNCWSSIVSSTSSFAAVQNSTTSPHSSPNNVYFYNSGDASATLLLISPEFSDLTSQARRIKFYAKGGTGYNVLVGTMSDPADEGTFTLFETVAITGTYTQYTVDFNGTYTGTDTYIAFKHGLGGTYRTMYIDDFSYEIIQAVAPDPATVSFPTDALVTLNNPLLSWIPAATGEPATGYKVYVSTTNPPPTTTPVYDGANTSFQTTGLVAGTQYYWQVVPYNDNGNTVGASVWSFTTVADGYLAESFENTTFPPTGWANPGDWSRSTSQYFAGDASAYKYSSTTENLLRTPMVTLTGTSTLDFFARTGSSNTSQRIQVQYSADAVSWTDIGSENSLPSDGTWTQYSVDLSSLTGNDYYLALAVYTIGSGGSVYVDHVIGPMITPLTPDAVTLSSPADAATNQTATPSLSWTAAATGGVPTGYKIFLDENADPTALYADVASSPYSVSPALNYNTTYYWKVVAYNGSGDGDASVIRSFTTMLDPTLTPPFTETFSSYPPTNWGEAAGLLAAPVVFSSTSSSSWTADGFANVGTSGAARLEIYSTTTDEWLITPPINLGDGSTNFRLTFDLALTYWNTTGAPATTGVDDKFAVIISTDNGATWTSVNTLMLWDNAGSANVYNDISITGENIIIDLSSYTGIVQLGFYGESTISNADNNVYVDNVTVEEIPLNPVFAVSPDSKDFGTVNTGEASSAQTFTISNTGAGTLQITGTALSGADADQFSLEDLNTYPVDLTNGQSITVDVTFEPTSDGSKTASLDISDDQGGGDHQVGLIGQTPPQGSLCSNPLPLTLPATDVSGNTNGYGDDYNDVDINPSSYYLGGDDVVYEFTVAAGILTGTITTTDSYIGAFVLADCPNSSSPPTPVIQKVSSGTSLTFFEDISAGTYYLIISSWPAPQSITYNINLSLTEYPATCVWAGTTNNDWNTATNWDNGVPGSSTNVTIPTGLTNYPTLGAAGACNNLTIESDATGSGSLLGQNYLTVHGTTTIERYSTASNWHGISGPLDNDDFNSLYLGGSPNVWVTTYDESTNDYTYVTDLATDLGDAKGWMVWIGGSTAQTFDFTGDLRTGTVGPIGLANTGPDADHGFNFVGNPYPSAIDWDAGGWTKTNVDAGIWLWNPDGGGGPNWATYITGSGGTNGGTQYISMAQGFFVQVNSTQSSGTLQMTTAVQVHDDVSFMKTTTTAPAHFIRLQIADGSLSDESIIRLDDMATEGYDSELDMRKMFSWSDQQPQLFSTANGNMAINVLPLGTASVPMDVRGVDGNQMSIAVNEVTDFDHVYLSDDHLGIQTDLMEQPYSFIYDASLTDRFTIYFTTVGTEENQLESIQVFSFDKNVRIIIPMETKAHVEVINMLGQTVTQTDAYLGTTDIHLDHPGYYLVNISNNSQTISRKVFIK